MTNWPAVITWATAEILSLPLALLTPVSVYFAPIITIPYSFAVFVGLTKLFVSKGWMKYKDEEVLPEDDEDDDGDKIHASTDKSEARSEECEA